ncbi:uncharacterized protein LOC115067354 [Nannospalax galili]|uniref:uncharacterized protein LOC115067354 n=1 Tax=Nannospalax galili TaxID=1026970 RepID=UPI00111C4B38|nr:uncharacterized protein LOC115067354 [Nannospalax galili]
MVCGNPKGPPHPVSINGKLLIPLSAGHRVCEPPPHPKPAAGVRPERGAGTAGCQQSPHGSRAWRPGDAKADPTGRPLTCKASCWLPAPARLRWERERRACAHRGAGSFPARRPEPPGPRGFTRLLAVLAELPLLPGPVKAKWVEIFEFWRPQSRESEPQGPPSGWWVPGKIAPPQAPSSSSCSHHACPALERRSFELRKTPLGRRTCATGGQEASDHTGSGRGLAWHEGPQLRTALPLAGGVTWEHELTLLVSHLNTVFSVGFRGVLIKFIVISFPNSSLHPTSQLLLVFVTQ